MPKIWIYIENIWRITEELSSAIYTVYRISSDFRSCYVDGATRKHIWLQKHFYHYEFD